MQPKEARSLVATALRSGKYAQGKYQLRHKGTTDSFCCLGVACEVYQEQVGGLETELRGDTYYAYDGEGCGLPVKVQHWLGMNSSGQLEGNFPDPANPSSLISANDGWDYDFNKIANLFETAEFVVSMVA